MDSYYLTRLSVMSIVVILIFFGNIGLSIHSVFYFCKQKKYFSATLLTSWFLGYPYLFTLCQRSKVEQLLNTTDSDVWFWAVIPILLLFPIWLGSGYFVRTMVK